MKSAIDKNGLGKIPTYDRKQISIYNKLDADYDTKQPSNHNNFRPRDFNKEMTAPIMKYTYKDEKERIQEKISNIPKLSTEPLNTLLLVKPRWREHDESKWVGGKEF